MLRAAVAMLLAAVAMGQVSPADAQERETVSKLLASPRDTDKAWAANLAANYRQPRFVPEIVELLSRRNSAFVAALDALIRLDGDPPEVAMRALIDAHPEHFDAMLILMGRRPGIHHTFLETLLGRDLGDDQWASLHAVLALSPAQRQVSHLWNAWTLRVRVSDRGQAEAVDRPERSCDVDLVPEIANDYPRSRHYVLRAADSSVLTSPFVSQGPHTVEVHSFGSCYSTVDRGQYTLDYLRYFARPVGESPPTVLRWSSAPDFETDARELMTRWRSHVSYLRGRLIENRLLSSDAPWPKIEVVDERHDKSVPLPSVDFTF